jgi:uncharacterized membrane protein
MSPWYDSTVIMVSHTISIVGGGIITYGALRATIDILIFGITKREFDYNAVRRQFTSKILIDLEFFVAGDLLKTILEPTVNQVILLGGIVTIRTIIEYFLTRELKESGTKEPGTQK